MVKSAFPNSIVQCISNKTTFQNKDPESIEEGLQNIWSAQISFKLMPTFLQPAGDLRVPLFRPMRAEQYNLHVPHRPIEWLDK